VPCCSHPAASGQHIAASLAGKTAVAAASLAASLAAFLAGKPDDHQLETVAPAEFVEHTAVVVEQSSRGKQFLAASLAVASLATAVAKAYLMENLCAEVPE